MPRFYTRRQRPRKRWRTGHDREDFATLDVVSSGRAELWVGVPFEVGAADLYLLASGRIAKDASWKHQVFGR